ncbi:Uma2 family endonuclease [Streptomyces sp. YIM S03343]
MSDEWRGSERLLRMPLPEGLRAEIVDGVLHSTPQSDTHWRIILSIVMALDDRFGRDAIVFSDVPIDFPGLPGRDNAFCPDVAKLTDSAKQDSGGHWRYQDVEFITEVISEGTAQNDYGPKKAAYARAEVPVYLIVDPYLGKCRLFTQPKEGDYVSDLTVAFGGDVDMTTTLLGLTLPTDDFPRG